MSLTDIFCFYQNIFASDGTLLYIPLNKRISVSILLSVCVLSCRLPLISCSRYMYYSIGITPYLFSCLFFDVVLVVFHLFFLCHFVTAPQLCVAKLLKKGY